MTDRDLMQQAADVLQAVRDTPASKDEIQRAWIVSDLLKRRLAQPERHELQAKGEHPAPCARHCEATAFQIVINNLKAQLAQPEQEPVALPCCGYADASAIKWNPYNQVVQCHNCGQTYTTPPQRKPLPPQSPCEMTQAEGKMFKLGWLECEAAHGIKGEA